MDATEDLYSKIKTNSSRVQAYERRDLQTKALACIPLAALERDAELAMSDYQARRQTGAKNEPGLRDFLIVEILHWFKDSFFSWVDTLPCGRCEGSTKMSNLDEPTEEEFNDGASRVEIHSCTKCQNQERFPRYNNPGKLLETRRGRCGEWANCFTLLCRAVGYDARYVLDWTDHVWTEVYSDSQSRWLHCDPCEALCDAPLIYEAGWGKKLSYIIGFSCNEVQDVTWRYTSDFAATLARRTAYPEGELISVVLAVTNLAQHSLSSQQKNDLLLRRLQELVEFLTPGKVSDSERQGRTSGSMSWRRQRGELGYSLGMFKPYVYRLVNRKAKSVVFRYSMSHDEYSVLEDGEEAAKIRGWANGAFRTSAMFRKVEKDWKMAYLARHEGTVSGSISWKLDFSPTHMVDHAKVTCGGATYEDGKVTWCLIGEKERVPFSNIGNQAYVSAYLQDTSVVELRADVSGGKGCNAWQHAQLFRSPLDCDNYNLELTITLVELPAPTKS